jgi:excisionase family DNA binding protein
MADLFPTTSKTQAPPPEYLTTSGVAGMLHVSPKTVSRWAQEGKLPFVRTLGGHRRYPYAPIREMADGLVVEPSAPGYFNPPTDQDERDG